MPEHMNAGKIVFIMNDESKVEIKPDLVLCNEVIFGHEYNPYSIRPWIIWDEHGNTIGLIWASNEQDALDEAVDQNLLDNFLIEEKDIGDYEEDEISRLGNSGEPFILGYMELKSIDISKQFVPVQLMFAEARGVQASTLDEL